MSTVDPSPPFGGSRNSRLEFEALLSDLSSRFIDLSPDEVDREIEDAMRRVCESLGVDFCVLWQWSNLMPGVITPTHIHYAHGELRSAEPPTQMQFPWVESEVRACRAVVLPTLDAFPDEAGLDRESAMRFGILSSLTLPLSVGGEAPVGALAFNTQRAHRDWPEALVRRLQLIAQVFTNALARQRRELDLQESRERLEMAADAAEAGLWTLDFATGGFWATGRAREIFGYSPDEALDLARFEASVHPNDWGLVRGAIDRSRSTGEPLSVEYRILRPGDGQVRWIASRGRPSLAASGRPVRLMGLSADITERKGVDEALRASEARLVAGADLAGLGFYEVNYETRTAFLDARLRLLLGLPPEPAPDLSDVELFMSRVHPDDGPSFFEQRVQLHDGRVPEVSVEYRYLHPTRGERWLDHVARIATRDAEGRVLQAYGVVRDITARRQREAALRDSLAEIERLRDRLQAESDYLKAEIKLAHAHGEITGKSAAIRKVLRQVEQVAPTGSTVLISGETGTGKELVARAIHRLSPRHGRLMVSVNCAALPSGLLESELFGREKGAYTGAMTRQVGRFEVADGSTLFLDEVGELSLEMQAKLLRVLETGAFERLGSPRAIRVDVRVIAATHRDLADDVRTGRFREDLFYRLNVFPIRVPPLRERTEDLPLLVWALLEECSARMGKKITKVPRLTMEALQRRPWPGNVRELRNLIEHATIVTEGEVLRIPLLEEPALASAPPRTLAESEREIILGALETAHWHIKGPQGAASRLGLKPSTLYGRMRKLGIRPSETKEDGAE